MKLYDTNTISLCCISLIEVSVEARGKILRVVRVGGRMHLEVQQNGPRQLPRQVHGRSDETSQIDQKSLDSVVLGSVWHR